MEAIIGRLKRDKRGVSNVIVIMLSLILVVIIVGNVILWSYQMNQLDWEKIQENVTIADVTQVTRSSSWFTANNEFLISVGTKIGGTYVDTKAFDGSYEIFREEKMLQFNPYSYILGGSTRHVSGSIEDLKTKNNVYMRFESCPNYEIAYQESLYTSSTTSTTYQDKVTINFTPQKTADFIIIATAEVQGSSTMYQAKARLVENVTVFQELLYRVKDTTDWYPFCGLKRLTLQKGITYSIKIQYCTSNAGGTAYIRNARLLLLSLQSEYAESETLSTASSTEWQDKVTLNFTPHEEGDYLIIATANYRGSSTNYDVRIQLLQDDSIVLTETVGRPGSGTTANYYTFGVMKKVTLTPTIHNFKIQYCSSSTSAAAGINYAHILALRLDQFDVSYYAEDESESTTPAPNVWYDKVVNTYAADGGDYLMFGSISYMSGSQTQSIDIDFQTDGVSRQMPSVEHRAVTTYESAFFMTKQSLMTGSKTDKIRWRAESTSARVKKARLISCKLPTLKQIAEVEFIGVSNVQNWTSLEWTIACLSTTANSTLILQLFNYHTGQYPISGDGFMQDLIGASDVTKNQTIIDNPTNYRDSEGYWKIKISLLKATTTQFELQVDWIEFKVILSNTYRLSISNSFQIDLTTYPLSYLNGFEITVKYNITGDGERWFLKVYNWSANGFSDLGFNNTLGNQPTKNEWNAYSVSALTYWRDYISDNGTIIIAFFDEGVNTQQSIVEIDFFGVRAITNGASFHLRNSGSLTTHIVAVWIINSTSHRRYSVNLYINSGEEATYIRIDISLPETFIAKVVTERGNIAVFQSN